MKALVIFLCFLAPLCAKAGSLQALKSGDLAGAWLIKDKQAPSLKLSLYILTGERDGIGAEGLAHFVEHLAWENMSDKDAEPRVGHSNAFTSSDLMAYWLSGEYGQLEPMLANLLRALQPLEVSEQFALEEREIIQREYDFRERENWRSGAWQRLLRRLHSEDPRQRDVGGSPENIDGYTLAQGAALHQRTHTPENAVLVLRGNLSKRAANRAIENLLNSSTSKRQALPRGSSADYRMGALERDVQSTHYSGVSQAELLYAKVVQLPQPVAIPQLLAESELLSSLLNSRLDGGLQLPLHYDNFIANEVGVEISVIDSQHVLIYVEAVPDIGIELHTLLQAVEHELEKTAHAGVPVHAFNKIKKRVLERDKDDNQPRLQEAMLREYLALRVTPVDIKTQHKTLRSVQAEALTQRLRAIAGAGRVVAELVQ